jgi:hypothetical protein
MVGCNALIEDANYSNDGLRLKERIILLKRLIPELDIPEHYEFRVKVIRYLEQEGLPITDININSLAKILSDEQLERLLMLSIHKDLVFRGNYYTFTNGILQHRSSWDELKDDIMCIIMHVYGRRAYAIFKSLLEFEHASTSAITSLASRFYGERMQNTEVDEILRDMRDRWKIVYNPSIKRGSINNGSNYGKGMLWALLEEVKPLVQEVINSISIPRLSTRDAYNEFEEILRMENEFRSYLFNLMKNRLEDVIRFGKSFDVNVLIKHLSELFGILYFDPLLAIAQQYSLSDTSIVSSNNTRVLGTGFNLALFGDSGSGKTFTIKDLILGAEEHSVPAYGLPGINRYCGGVTPAKFIAMGEAYEGRRFNFIVTEFNEWFKYKGMVEPLKIAMERGIIRYETKSYSVRAYRFTSFFSVNYNTSISSNGYKVTIKDPNFKAIEDRMLCRLHRLTKDKYYELAKRQRELMKGLMQEKMLEMAYAIRDHLTLVYAIQIRDSIVRDGFNAKDIMVNDSVIERIEYASRLILDSMSEDRVPFSIRLEKKALQLASSLSLLKFFITDSDTITIDGNSLAIALRFFVEEAWMRSNNAFDLNYVIQRLDIDCY